MDAGTEGLFLRGDEGAAHWFLGTLTTVKATGATTQGAFDFVEQVLPGGFAAPPHVHHDHDEVFYILEGEWDFFCGERNLQVGAGAFLFLPRDIPHGFSVTSAGPARALVLSAPAKFAPFVEEFSEPAARRELPEPSVPDVPRLIEVAARHNIEILPPPGS